MTHSVKEVWQLNAKDYKEIEDLFEKKLALENLSKIVDPSNEALYNKLIADYGKVIRQFTAWWEEMSKKHNWYGKNWWLDFKTKKIMTND